MFRLGEGGLTRGCCEIERGGGFGGGWGGGGGHGLQEALSVGEVRQLIWNSCKILVMSFRYADFCYGI